METIDWKAKLCTFINTVFVVREGKGTHACSARAATFRHSAAWGVGIRARGHESVNGNESIKDKDRVSVWSQESCVLVSSRHHLQYRSISISRQNLQFTSILSNFSSGCEQTTQWQHKRTWQRPTGNCRLQAAYPKISCFSSHRLRCWHLSRFQLFRQWMPGTEASLKMTSVWLKSLDPWFIHVYFRSTTM